MSLRCRLCTAKAKCVNSRAGAEGIVNRRYHCGNCGSKFTSVEVIVTFAGEPVPMPTGSKGTSLEQLRKNVMRSELEKLQ